MTQIETLDIYFTVFLMLVIGFLSFRVWLLNQAYNELQKNWRIQELLLGREKRRNESFKRYRSKLVS